MRIAILVNLFPPKQIGGMEIATYNLADNLAQRGHEVHVITSQDDSLPKLSEESSFYIHRVTRPKIRIIGYIPFWIRMCLRIQKIKPNIVHSQSLVCGAPAWVTKQFLNIPYVVWGMGSDIYLHGKLLSMISKPILQNADAVLALTEDMRQEMQNICDRRISVVPNGIDLKNFTFTSNCRKERDVRTVIFVGRLHPVKGVQYLIEAMAMVHQKIPAARLVIVGDGTERSGLEKLVKKLDLGGCIQFTGKVPHEEVPKVMHQADIFVLPSLSEGFPGVLLEAMAIGLPVIATSVGGIPSIIDEGINGYLVSTKSPDEIADRILMLMLNDRMRETISTNNREKVKVFTWDEIAGKVERIYQGATAAIS